MKLSTSHGRVQRHAAFTLLEVLVVVAILVILASVGIVATTKYLEDARKSKAQLQCQSFAEACEAYYLNPQSGGNYPTQLSDLNQPFGGTGGQSYLKNGVNDLVSPWGQQSQYVLTTYQNSDGSLRPLVQINAPDGTPISQFGIGPMSQPPVH
jgi:general secretion pathway protein G